MQIGIDTTNHLGYHCPRPFNPKRKGAKDGNRAATRQRQSPGGRREVIRYQAEASLRT
jgi:hypothetical protein